MANFCEALLIFYQLTSIYNKCSEDSDWSCGIGQGNHLAEDQYDSDNSNKKTDWLREHVELLEWRPLFEIVLLIKPEVKVVLIKLWKKPLQTP